MTDTITRVRLASEALTKDIASGTVPVVSSLELQHALRSAECSQEAIAVSATILQDALGERAKEFGSELQAWAAPWAALAGALMAGA